MTTAKDKKQANGVAPGLEAHPLREVGAELAKADKGAATQTRLDLGDAQVSFEQLEFEVALSATEAALKDHEASQKMAEAKRRELALNALIEISVTPEKAAIKELRAEAEKLSTESASLKHKVIRRTEVVYRPNTLSVHFFEPGSDRKIVVMQERRMTEAEIKSFETIGGPPSAKTEELPVVAAPPEPDEVTP